MLGKIVADLSKIKKPDEIKNKLLDLLKENDIKWTEPVPPYPQAGEYGDFYNHDRYTVLLMLTKLAYIDEQNGSPQEHAFKLSIIFDSEKEAIKYIEVYLKQKIDKQYLTLHNACLFSIPTPDCNISYWKKLAKSNMDNAKFREALKQAKDIEQLVSDNKSKRAELGDEEKEQRKAKVVSLDAQVKDLKCNKALKASEKNAMQLILLREKYDVTGRYDPELIKLQTEKIEAVNKDYKAKKRKQDTAGMTPLQKMQAKEELGQLAAELTRLKLELFEISKGRKLTEYSVAQILACVEYRKNQDHGAVNSYLINKGMSQKVIYEFHLLLPKDDDVKIPPMVIDGKDIGHPGYYLRRLNVENPMDAAIGATLGVSTGCCQSMGDAGNDCAVHGITSENGGFYVVFKGDHNNPDANDEIIGQCWAWRSQSNAIVFDSIESNNSNNKSVTDFYQKLGFELIEKGHTRKVNCGATSGISATLGLVLPVSIGLEVPNDYTSYRDSIEQRLIYDKNAPFHCYDLYDFAKYATDNLLEEVIGDKRLNLRESKVFCDMLNSIKLGTVQSQSLQQKINDLIEKNNRTEEYRELSNDLDKYHTGEISLNDIKEKSKYTFLIPLFDKKGCTLLHNAALEQDIELARYLLANDANANAVDQYCKTALGYAVQKGNVDLVKLLLKNEPDLNARDFFTETVLMTAVRNGHIEVVKVLIEHGADVNAITKHGKTVLMFAAQAGYVDLVKLLLEKGAVLDKKDHNEKTVLMYATENCHANVVELLMNNRVDINVNAKNIYEESALMYLAKRGNHLVEKALKVKHAINSLLQYGADINATNSDGKTALIIAVTSENVAATETLVSQGADVTVKDNNNKTVFDYASPELAEIIRKAQADRLAIADKPKITPLHSLRKEGEVKTVDASTKENKGPSLR